MIDKYESICLKLMDLITVKFSSFVIDKDESPFKDYAFIKIIGSGINKFIGNKIYIDTSSVDNHKTISTDYSITYENRPSRANMQPVINSTWLAKIKDSPKFIKVDEYSDFELNNLIFSTGFLGLKSDNKYTNNYLYTLICSKEFQEKKNQVSVGATMQSVNNDVFKDIAVPNVTEDETIEFGKSVDKMYENIYIIRKKIEILRILKFQLLEKYFS